VWIRNDINKRRMVTTRNIVPGRSTACIVPGRSTACSTLQTSREGEGANVKQNNGSRHQRFAASFLRPRPHNKLVPLLLWRSLRCILSKATKRWHTRGKNCTREHSNVEGREHHAHHTDASDWLLGGGGGLPSHRGPGLVGVGEGGRGPPAQNAPIPHTGPRG
jgi:hypothetical protein